jgi:seryl-tRNA synthetase
MLDLQYVRENLTEVAQKLALRGFNFDVNFFSELDAKRKQLQVATQAVQQQRNSQAKEIGLAKSKGIDITSMLAQVESMGEELSVLEQDLKNVQDEMHNYMLTMPNIAHHSVPVGESEADNKLVRTHGEIRKFDFTPKQHFELNVEGGILDFNASAKLSGSRFVVMKGKMAALHRALAQFMLDVHTSRHGYTEVYAPLLVKDHCLFGTSQFPKFKDDQFATEGQDLWLIPTAEVSLTNLHREEILEYNELPIKYVAHTPCFRKEAGSYGRDTKGIIRQHQFDKVELVQIVDPKHSYTALEDLVSHAEKILQLLKLPYRVMALCTKDMGFGASKTYDLEVWLPGQNAYREISSCSNTESFQARRMQTRIKNSSTKEIQYAHTLNGSGLAVGRTLVAVLENYQTADGDVIIPEVLHKYFY